MFRHEDCKEGVEVAPIRGGREVNSSTRETTMSRIQILDPKTSQGRAKELLDAVQKKLGVTPNMMRALANSPAALQAYLDFGGALAGGALSTKVREQIALTIGEINSCGYCLSAHTLLGGKAGLTPEQVLAARRATADDPKANAILHLAKEIALRRGELRDQDLRAARDAGVTDGEIAEVVGAVALNIFTNYFNAVAVPPIDFPEVKPGVAAAAHA